MCFHSFVFVVGCALLEVMLIVWLPPLFWERGYGLFVLGRGGLFRCVTIIHHSKTTAASEVMWNPPRPLASERVDRLFQPLFNILPPRTPTIPPYFLVAFFSTPGDWRVTWCVPYCTRPLLLGVFHSSPHLPPLIQRALLSHWLHPCSDANLFACRLHLKPFTCFVRGG